MIFVSLSFPRGDLINQRPLIGNTPIQTLPCQHAQFGPGHIEPASVLRRVMPLKPFHEAACLDGGKRVIKRRGLMGVEIILDEHDLRHVWKVPVRQLFQDMRIIHRGTAIRGGLS